MKEVQSYLSVVLGVIEREAGVDLELPDGVDDPLAAQVQHAHVGLPVLVLDDLEALVYVAAVHGFSIGQLLNSTSMRGATLVPCAGNLADSLKANDGIIWWATAVTTTYKFNSFCPMLYIQM